MQRRKLAPFLVARSGTTGVPNRCAKPANRHRYGGVPKHPHVDPNPTFDVRAANPPTTHRHRYGGVPKHPQVDALRKGVQIVVATPGRLIDLLHQGALSLSEVSFLVSARNRNGRKPLAVFYTFFQNGLFVFVFVFVFVFLFYFYFYFLGCKNRGS